MAHTEPLHHIIHYNIFLIIYNRKNIHIQKLCHFIKSTLKTYFIIYRVLHFFETIINLIFLPRTPYILLHF